MEIKAYYIKNKRKVAEETIESVLEKYKNRGEYNVNL